MKELRNTQIKWPPAWMNMVGCLFGYSSLLKKSNGEIDDETDKAEIDVFEISGQYLCHKEPCQRLNEHRC